MSAKRGKQFICIFDLLGSSQLCMAVEKHVVIVYGTRKTCSFKKTHISVWSPTDLLISTFPAKMSFFFPNISVTKALDMWLRFLSSVFRFSKI